MCVYSLVTQHYTDKWYPFVVPCTDPKPNTAIPNTIGIEDVIQMQQSFRTVSPLTKEEIDQFRRDVAEFRVLLDRAREYDARNNEPECESDEKRKLLRQIAAALGIDVLFV